MEDQMEITKNRQRYLPYSTGVLVLGILSIIFCFGYGFIGVVLGIISLLLASKANKIYLSNPKEFTEHSYKNMKAGKVCAIVGLSLSGVYVMLIIAFISFFSHTLFALPWSEMIEHMQSW